jgi:hypothetical protein
MVSPLSIVSPDPFPVDVVTVHESQIEALTADELLTVRPLAEAVR